MIAKVKVYRVLTLLLLFSFVACNKNQEVRSIEIQRVVKNPNLIKITGNCTIGNSYGEIGELRIEFPNIYWEKTINKIPINEDGSFEFEFELAQPQSIILPPFIDFLYVSPGDSIHLEIGKNNKSSISGSSAEINNEFESYFSQTYYRSGEYQTNIGPDSNFDAIRTELNTNRTDLLEQRNDFLIRNKVSPEVEFATEVMIELDFYAKLIQSFSMLKKFVQKDLEVEPFFEEVNKKAIPYFFSGMILDNHLRFIDSYRSLVRHMAEPGKMEHDKHIEWIKQISPNDTIRDFIFSTDAAAELEMKNLKVFERYYQEIEYPYLQSRLMHDYSIALDKIQNPEQRSSTILGRSTDSDNRFIDENNVLAKIVDQHPGKVIYIDIWTTWCPPCIVEMPYYKNLTDQYAQEDVEFVFICVGEDEKRSQKILTKYGLQNNTAIFATGKEHQSLLNAFGAFPFPFGILINKKGVIVDYGTLSQFGLNSKIDLLLKQDTLEGLELEE